MSFAYLQSTSISTTAGATNTLTLPSQVSKNSLIVVSIRMGDTTTTISSIADNVSTVYSQVGSQIDGGGDVLYAWQGLNTASSGNNTLTVTNSAASGSSFRMSAAEYGSDGTQSRDTFRSTDANTNTPTAGGTITPAGNNELIIGLLDEAGGAGAISATGSFTLRESVDVKEALEDWIQTSATATDVGFSLTNADNCAAFVIAYKQTAGGATTVVRVPQLMTLGVGV